MSLIDTPSLFVPSHQMFAGQTFVSLLMDATGEKAALVAQVPKTGTITHVGFRTGAVTTSETLNVALQPLDTSGNPTGANYGGSVAGTQAAPAATTFYEVALATPATAVRADCIAAVIAFNAAVGNLNITMLTALLNTNFPYGNLYTGSWTHQSGLPILSLKYDDGSYADCRCVPCSNSTLIAINSGSTPDEYALRFKWPTAVRISGFFVFGSVAANTADFEVVLYGSDGTTALQTLAHDGNFTVANSSARVMEFLFATPQTLVADTFYWGAIKPTTVNNFNINYYSFASEAVMDSLPGGRNFHMSTRTNAGAWTHSTTDRPMFGVILDQIHNGAGGGGLIGGGNLSGGLQ